jgi:carbon monoxide dehydrogenase subunit G
MAGHTVTVKREVLAEPATVWAVVADIDRADKILTAVDKVERLAGTGFEVGTRWLETRRVMGKAETEEMWVLESEAPRHAVIAAESNGTLYRTAIEVRPSSMGTTLVFTFSAETAGAGRGQKVMFALLGKAGVKAAKSSLEQDLADIAKAIERRARR